jgi:2'-5' RNA ligase
MPFAIELLFDAKTDKAVRRLGNLLEKKKIPTILSARGASPHVSLAVFDEFNRKRVFRLLERLAERFPPTPFELESLGSFTGEDRALFLAPVVTPDLLNLHHRLHLALKNMVKGTLSYYLPGQWVPHCTLGMRFSRKDLTRAFDFLQKTPYGMRGLYNRLALVEYHPVKELYSVHLTGPNR